MVSVGELNENKNHLFVIDTLKDELFYSADLIKDEVLNSADLLRERQHLLGINVIG